MRTIILLCIVCLMVTGIVSASGVVPAERTVRNANAVVVPVTTTAAPANTSFVQTLVNPIVQYIPGMATITPTPVPQSFPARNTVALSGPAPTQAVPGQETKSMVYQYADMQIQKSADQPPTDHCSIYNPDFKEMEGTVYILMVQEKPVITQQSVILAKDKTLYGIISDNPNFFPLMQTAMITGKPVRLAAYLEPAPPEGLGGLWPIYRSCWMYVDNS